jgi:hypothetical protein
MNYESQIKELVIKEFVSENNRVPTLLELKQLIADHKTKYPNLSVVGRSGYEVVKPSFMSVSSSTDENQNTDSLTSDFILASKRIDYLAEQLVSTDIGLSSTVRKLQRELNTLEGRLDNILLFTQEDNPFLIGIEENFANGDKFDFSRSTASLESFGLTSGRRSLTPLNLKNTNITYSTSSNKGYLSFFNNSTTDSLKEDDGITWTHQVYTNYSSGRVTLQLNVNLNSEEYVSNIRLVFASFSKDSNMQVSTSYSVDGKTYLTLEPAEVSVTNHEYSVDVGIGGVQKIRFLISKEFADAKTSVGQQHVYHFSIDSLKIYTSDYSAGDSIAYLGPYEMLDDRLNEYNFTKATCELCLTSGDNTAANVFLSKDNITYFPLKNSNDYVIFGSSISDSSGSQISETSARYLLVDDSECEYNSSKEGILNFYIPTTYTDRVIPKTLLVKRNIVVSDSLDFIDGVDPGWVIKDSLYRTTIFVDNPGGTVIDLGPTTAYLNDIEVTGKVSLPYGYSVFATGANNWREIDTGALSLGDLKNKDKLYPYNHKLIIEGYSYPKAFNGEKVYFGYQHFGHYMKYVPASYFDSVGYDPTIFTYEEVPSGWKFKVKVDKSRNNWALEKFSGEWRLQDTSGNDLWVKILLRGKTKARSAIVNSFKLRVI